MHFIMIPTGSKLNFLDEYVQKLYTLPLVEYGYELWLARKRSRGSSLRGGMVMSFIGGTIGGRFVGNGFGSGNFLDDKRGSRKSDGRTCSLSNRGSIAIRGSIFKGATNCLASNRGSTRGRGSDRRGSALTDSFIDLRANRCRGSLGLKADSSCAPSIDSTLVFLLNRGSFGQTCEQKT